MAEAASACFPEECCGILIGAKAGGRMRVTRAVRAANVVPTLSRRRRFEIDPAVLIAVQRQLREAGSRERLLGYFHSHPFGPLRPSDADRRGVSEAGLATVIVRPVARTGRTGFGVWLRLGDGNAARFRPLGLSRRG
jgi:proteasome lid subunit RPN8/RPN11